MELKVRALDVIEPKSVQEVEQELLDKTSEGKRTALALDQSISDKMKGFSKIVEDSFGKMADALVDFAKTGKLNFSSLVSDMIMELARFELRAQMSSMYKGMGGLGGMLGGIQGMFNQSGVSGVSIGSQQDIMLAAQTAGMAKGGAYVHGVEAFAKGGMFTNSIVNSPTLFKFAQGTGLMGEAGPEAIMPLKRDSQGNLGVRTNQQQNTTQVVVNNYGSEQATTKETTDSKGNRKIEVIIGELVSREMSRPNSPINTSLKSNFQVQPTLVRR